MFFDEFDALALRIAELRDVVDRFVLAEATTTHAGEPKDVFFDDRADDFADVADRITVVEVDDLPRLPNRWIAEHVQRNAVMRGLDDAEGDDLIVVSDCDEIPRADAVRRAGELVRNPGDVAALVMPVYYYALNLRSDEWWDAPRVTRRATLDHLTPQELRTTHVTTRVPNGGWHFSYLAPTAERASRIARKAHAFAHSEFDVEQLTDPNHLGDVLEHDELWWTGTGPGGPRLLHRVPVDGSLPSAVTSDPERWRDFVVDGAGDLSYEARYQWRRLRREARRGAYFVRRSLRGR
jgi:hypothetical protein